MARTALFGRFEASGRVGGRMHSDTTSWSDGQVSEHCGELIDSGHTALLGLARHLDLPVTDLLAAEPPGSTETYVFRASYYPAAQADSDFAQVYTALRADLKAAGYPTTFDRSTAAGQALDQMSVADWIDARVPGGHGSAMGQLLDVAYDIEFGAPTTAQSALNVVYLLAFQNDPSAFGVFGVSDEHYHITGGNERLPAAVAARLEAKAPGTIQLGTALTALRRRADGRYALELSGAAGGTEVADHVILALPFSVLRRLDTHEAGFDARKRRAIRELGYGTNTKLQLQFSARPWNQAGPWGIGSGTSYSDTGYQNTWDVTRGQPGAGGILVDYLGSAGARLRGDPADPDFVHGHARRFLARLDPVFPGIASAWTGRATLDLPHRNPLLRGSYSFWKVGQYTSIAGAEGLRQGNCHFAGEHCSINFQGFMEGGVREGRRAALEVLTDLGIAA